MSSQVQENLVSSNEKYASNFKHGDLPLPPAKKYLVVTCMDARIDPAAAFGISLGDAHVIRNMMFTQAGASASDALRSIIISQQLLGTNSVLLIKHTGCGMLTFENRDIYQVINRNLGQGATGELEAQSFDFQPFPDLEGAVREDVEFLRKSQLVAKGVEVSGWVYEVESGRVRKVI
ncbi:hypothetical protein EPUS_01878 [Endocarpon pusillum Z07020]|uniref:Carbonic anhydrase n=1 Tax=Endocarpon pusillum (strain Z07020 / HMAS-L-300199) TaxID=1263415 RepID=U1GBW6_ENDPU|nr:uncharacterized protein EPUS_01878 [Endocarpon pusillum Z07020]ERF69548.1 hypothetical protein EPUS_01878 [Endocarpon pusillum Z07020]